MLFRKSVILFLFQSTLPRRERQWSHVWGYWFFNFNPRSREGSDVILIFLINIIKISIHAPAKGATAPYDSETYYNQISIHAPAKGATKTLDNIAGVDAISIHAPAKGATFGTMPQRLNISNFNPRSREGSDRLFREKWDWKSRFQSTLPRRERLKCVQWKCDFYNFNPRSREGSDGRKQQFRWMDRISIHAPAKGATLCGIGNRNPFGFQSTLPRRERQAINAGKSGVKTISIHAPAKGATITSPPSYSVYLISIHAPAKGAT